MRVPSQATSRADQTASLRRRLSPRSRSDGVVGTELHGEMTPEKTVPRHGGIH
jgi:hypothetical protein